VLEIENDFVFAMLGAVPPPFVKAIGIRMIKRGRPSDRYEPRQAVRPGTYARFPS